MLGIVLALLSLPLFDYRADGDRRLRRCGSSLALAILGAWGVQAYFIKLANATMDAASIFFYMMLSGLLFVPVALAMTDFSQPINYGLDGPGLAAVIQIAERDRRAHARVRVPLWQGDHRLAARECGRAAAHGGHLAGCSSAWCPGR